MVLRIDLECDGCGEVLNCTVGTEGECLSLAEEKGWTTGGKDSMMEDLCPRCSKAEASK